MPASAPILTRDTFAFLRDLTGNNSKEWMDANRQRYQETVVAPFRALLEALAPAALQLHPDFDVSGRTGPNFSRINRDIRFARDKTPYRPQMYLMFPDHKLKDGGQLYVGVMPEEATIGFRIYGMKKESLLARITRPRALQNLKWVARQKQRLGRKYESYWYSTEKGEWTRHKGWPLAAEEWQKLKGWIVRKELKPSAVAGSRFPADAVKAFRELYPLFAFTSRIAWRK